LEYQYVLLFQMNVSARSNGLEMIMAGYYSKWICFSYKRWIGTENEYLFYPKWICLSYKQWT
jgi:hypothetical protein